MDTSVTGNINNDNLQTALTDGLVEIGTPADYTMRRVLADSKAPELTSGYPIFDATDTSATMSIQLTRTTGTIYYVVAPLNDISTKLFDCTLPLPDPIGNTSVIPVNDEISWGKLPPSASTTANFRKCSEPSYLNVMQPPYQNNSRIKTGSLNSL